MQHEDCAPKLAAGWMQMMVAKAQTRWPVGMRVGVFISSRQKTPSPARVAGHAIHLGKDFMPEVHLQVIVDTQTKGARNPQITREIPPDCCVEVSL